MATYIHELLPWPRFRWSEEEIAKALSEVHRRQGLLAGRMQALGFQLQQEAELSTLTEEALKSSEIEGKILDRDQVRSSIAGRLGMDAGGLPAADRNVEGIVDVMLDATQNFSDPLTKERIFAWHAALFPTGRSGIQKITVGTWRTDEKGPMQVTSGAIGYEKVHYEAPAAALLEDEMKAFIDWYNACRDGKRFRDLMVQEVGFAMLRDLGVTLIAADSPSSFLDDGPTSKLIRQILGAVSEFDKAMIVAKLKGARDRARRAHGKCEGRKAYAERERSARASCCGAAIARQFKRPASVASQDRCQSGPAWLRHA